MNRSNKPDLLTEIRSEHAKLAVLRLLHKSGVYSINSNVAQQYLARIGLASIPDEFSEWIKDLQEQGLLTVTWIEKLCVIELTERGAEVALGKTRVEGVLCPSPACPY